MNRDMLKAAVNGTTIQTINDGKWVDLSLEGAVRHFLNGTDQVPGIKYRVKPEQKIYSCQVVIPGGCYSPKIHACVQGDKLPASATWEKNLRLVFEDGKLVDAQVMSC